MALHDAGMSIPQDVSVLSCGTYFEGEPTRFPITEMPVMPEELCAEAMNLLVSAIEEHTDIKGSVEAHRTRAEAPRIRCGSGVRRHTI